MPFNQHVTPPDRYGTEPAIGWRTWFMDEGGALYSPRAVMHNTEAQGWGREEIIPDGLWLPGEPFEARCWVTAIPQHDAPNLKCGSCGVHAWKDGLRAALMFNLAEDPFYRPDGYAPVYGQAALWGRIIEHEEGYRGQFAYPHMLRCRGKECARRLYQTYGIETEAV